MAMDVGLVGGVTGNKAEVDSNNNAKVTLPNTNTQAGFARITAQAASGDMRDLVISDEGHAYVAQSFQAWEKHWNSAATNWANSIGTTATTLTKIQQNGFLRLNGGAVTTVNTGIAVYSNRTFNLEESVELRARMYVRHTNATISNKQFDLGLGYYAFAAGQAAAMNEFIGFRWTTAAGFQAVVGTSAGGVATEQTVNINGNVPYSDGVTREYELLVLESEVYFYVNSTWVATINRDPAVWATTKAVSMPWIARLYNGAVAPTLAPVFDIGEVSIRRVGDGSAMPFATVKAAMGNSSYHFQPDLGASTATHLVPASGTAPTGAVGSNTAAALVTTSMGGLVRNTLTGVTITLSTNVLWTGYTNPAYPTVSGVATNARVFYCTGITISPMIVTTALTGGGFTAAWFATIGATAVSLATADADGTTAVAQRAPRYVPLSLVSTLAATAALGVVSTDVGDHQYQFVTPLVVNPGEVLTIGMRTIAVTAAVTAGGADCMIGINGYWE
jgi:hypothetical protein